MLLLRVISNFEFKYNLHAVLLLNVYNYKIIHWSAAWKVNFKLYQISSMIHYLQCGALQSTVCS